MTRFFRMRILAGAAAVLAVGACKDLDIENPNAPDISRALASPEDVRSLAVSTMNSWYLTSTYLEPYIMTQVTADASTGNFGNFGMRFNNVEPRIPYGNSSAGGDRAVTESPWEGNYATLGAANDALAAINAGIVIDDAATTAKYAVMAKFSQAGSLANLGLLFDQAFIIDETYIAGTSDLPTLSPYPDVIAAAMSKWDETIAATASGSDSYSAIEFPLVGGLTSESLNRIANSMAAWTLVEAARNSAENQATDWNRVLQYAEKGISGPNGRGAPLSFVITADNNFWYSYINFYGNEHTWVKVDMRVICRMDPSQPCKYTGTLPPEATGPDARVNTDYMFESVIGDPNRGIWMQSPYHHQRYAYHARTSPTSGEGDVPYMLAAENDLIIAEALARTGGDLTRAAELVNRTHVGRGHLPPVGATVAEVLAGVDYERDVELLNTNGQQLYDRRRIDGLQPGTLRHLPIPASELETLALPVYTFGGVGEPDMVVIAPSGEKVQIRKPIVRRMSSARWLAPIL